MWMWRTHRCFVVMMLPIPRNRIAIIYYSMMYREPMCRQSEFYAMLSLTGSALAEGLAMSHARWWGAERLTAVGASMHDAAHIWCFVGVAAPGVENIIAHFASDSQTSIGRKPCVDSVAHHPQRLIERIQNPSGFTLIHGDVGEQNVLIPRQGYRPLYVIDRQPFNWSLTTWLGVYDIAYAVVLDRDWLETAHALRNRHSPTISQTVDRSGH